MLLSYLWKTFRLVSCAVLIILFVRTFLIETGRVNGVSMESTYLDSQTFYINKFALLLSTPKRGQIIQCKAPNGESLLIKRIVGLPGETVHIHENEVSVTDSRGNLIRLNETYLKPGSITQTWNHEPGDYPVLGPNEYFVMGDNRRESGDSRHFGPVPRENILGLVISPF